MKNQGENDKVENRHFSAKKHLQNWFQLNNVIKICTKIPDQA